MKNQRGQSTLGLVMVIGSILALIISYAWQRNATLQAYVNASDAALVANDILTTAGKKLQQLYQNEAGCDPDVLEVRVNTLPPPGATYNSYEYVVADPGVGASPPLTNDQRRQRCSSATGCRQIPVDQGGKAYLVTVGRFAKFPNPLGVTRVCTRDVTVRLKTAIRGHAFSRAVTLVNVCSYTSCNGPSFTGISGDVSATPQSTTACGQLAARKYGDMIGQPSSAASEDNVVNEHELRWARRYLETGGFDAGQTTYLAGTITAGNGSCAAGAGGCIGRACVPFFDLNRDGTNNDQDMAILEYYLRGFIPRMPTREF